MSQSGVCVANQYLKFDAGNVSNWSSKRNVELNKILDRTLLNIYGIVFKRLKSHTSFIRCGIKRLLDVLLYNTGYIWTRTQLEILYNKTSNNL